jgi:hypothetical protein
MWRYYTPEPLWGMARPLWRALRWRLLLGRVFLAGPANRVHALELEGDRFVIRRARPPGDAGAAPALLSSFMSSLRRAAGADGFWIPPLSPGGHGTSSHYAGTFPYGGSLVDVPRDGRILPGVHLADAATFVGSPAISPTFTILANAARTVHESLQG